MIPDPPRGGIFKIRGIYTKDDYHGRDAWYILLLRRIDMADQGIAKVFRNGRSQAVRLPREFRFEGEQVRVRRVNEGVLLEPLIADTSEWFAALDSLRDGDFLKNGRKQPATPRREIFK